MKGLKNGHLISQLCQVARTGQPGGTGPHHSHLFSVWRRFFDLILAVGHIPVGHEPLQTADRNRLALYAPDAEFLALALLGTDPAADRGQGTGLLNLMIGLFKPALRNQLDKLRYLHIDRTAAHTGAVLATKTPAGLLHRHFLGISGGDLLEILIPDIGVLFRHLHLFQ